MTASVDLHDFGGRDTGPLAERLGQRARGRVDEIVMRPRGVIDGILPAARRAPDRSGL